MRALRASKVVNACVALLAAVLAITASATAGAAAPRAVAPLDVTTSKLPGAKLDTLYKATLSATGGTKPYHWSVATGKLPRAMKLSGTGVISGDPQNEGRWAFKVRVTDAHGKTATQALSIIVTDPTPLPLEIWWSLNPELIANAPVPNVPLHVYRGQEPFTWSVSGAPPGISIDAAGGYLVGSPTLAGTYSTTFGVTDAKGRSASKTYTIRVIANVKLTGSLPDGRVGVPYASQVALAGGDAPFTWSVSGGALPPGLSLSGNGDISGTPTAAGTYDFEIRVADKWTQTAAVWFRAIITP